MSVAAQAAIEGAIAWPTVPATPDLMNVLTENLAIALEKRRSPEQALRDTQAEWQVILGRQSRGDADDGGVEAP